MAVPAITQTRIYNRALALLGSVNRSSNIDDGNPWTDTLNEHWPQAIRDLLAEHPWNCAIGRRVLNKSGTPVFGDGYTYQLPADCLRWLPPAPDNDDYFEGVEEGGYILADAGASINIRYIRLIEDVTAWPPHLTNAMSYRLAMDAADAITQSTSIVEDMRVKYEGRDGEGGALARAKRADGLASGNRSRGNVTVISRALSAGYRGTTYRGVPGIDY